MEPGIRCPIGEGRNSMWEKHERGWYFLPGKDASELAASEAGNCRFFRLDDEDECFAREDVSCYNCRYRRWTNDSFECMHREVRHE